MGLSTATTIADVGLRAIATETSIVSRNISGAQGTDYFSQRLAEIITTLSGPLVGSVTRATNQAVFANMLSSTSAAAVQTALLAGLDTLDQTVGGASGSGSTNSPAALLANFQSALQAYSATPSNSSLAGAAVAAAKSLASSLNSATDTVQAARAQADHDMAASINNINSLLSKFQALNAQVVAGTAAGADVTDAQDSRDAILRQLAGEIGISPVTGPGNDISIYTDSGVTLFQGGVARTLTFTPTDTFTPATSGNQVYANGVLITGSSAPMPTQGGKLAGLAALRDNIAVTYQAQLDNIAGGLMDAFSESDQVGHGPALLGLFTMAGATQPPTARTGLAGEIIVNRNVDPTQGGNANLLRDGGVSSPGNPNYVYNKTGDASYNGRILELIGNFSSTRSFGSGTAIATSASLTGYVAASAGWLEGQRSAASNANSYQNTLLDTATSALSNATGVNLDQEMSKMLALEQSYGASAKLITTINSMVGDLLNAI